MTPNIKKSTQEKKIEVGKIYYVPELSASFNFPIYYPVKNKEDVEYLTGFDVKEEGITTEQHEKEIQKIKENETKINFLWDENKVILSRGKESRILKIKEPKK